jgi:hypothetical protein
MVHSPPPGMELRPWSHSQRIPEIPVQISSGTHPSVHRKDRQAGERNKQVRQQRNTQTKYWGWSLVELGWQTFVYFLCNKNTPQRNENTVSWIPPSILMNTSMMANAWSQPTWEIEDETNDSRRWTISILKLNLKDQVFTTYICKIRILLTPGGVFWWTRLTKMKSESVSLSQPIGQTLFSDIIWLLMDDNFHASLEVLTVPP